MSCAFLDNLETIDKININPAENDAHRNNSVARGVELAI